MFIKYLVSFGTIVASSHFVYTEEISKFEHHTCSSLINAAQYKRNGFKISITRNANSRLKLPYTVLKCRRVLILNSTRLTALNISFVYANPNRQNALPCSTFTRIEFLVSTIGKPVKTVPCTDAGNWIIRWPWDTVVMDIYPSNELYTDESSVDVIITDAVGYYYEIFDNSRRREIRLPTKKGMSEYCLGQSRYEIIYGLNLFTSNSKRKEKKVKFRLISKSVCIKTKSISSWRAQCPWKVNLVINYRVVMVLQCKEIGMYWCLPKSWLKHTDSIEINFASSLDDYTNEKYKIYIQTKTYGKQCPGRTTSSYWSSWSSWSSSNKVNYNASKSKSSAGVIVAPIAGAAVLIFAIYMVCCASSIRSSHTRSNNGLNVPENNQNRITDGDDTLRNPAYRMHDPVRGPITSRPADDTVRNLAYRTHDPVRSPVTPRPADPDINYSYSDPPPNYSGCMSTSPSSKSQDTTGQPEYLGLAPTAPPPSYEAALDMIGTPEIP